MELKELRMEMDEADRTLVASFRRRMELSAAIAAYKAEHGLSVTDSKREEEKLDAVAALAGEAFADDARRLYELLFRLSKDYQQRLMEEREEQ